MRDGGWKRLDVCWGCFFFLFFSIGVASDWITWYQPVDCLVVYNSAKAATMEMSNAQSLFVLSMCYVYVTGDLVRECHQSSWSCRHRRWKQHSLPFSVFQSACVFLLSLCVILLSLRHINSPTQTHTLCRIQMVFCCRSRLQCAINLSGCNIQETFETTSKLPAVKTD